VRHFVETGANPSTLNSSPGEDDEMKGIRSMRPRIVCIVICTILFSLLVSSAGCSVSQKPATSATSPSSTVVSTVPSTSTAATRDKVPPNTLTSIPPETQLPPFSTMPQVSNYECSTDSLIISSVDSEARNGIHQVCIGSQQTRLIVKEGSEIIPEPWRLMDFDVSGKGNKLVFAVGQGSSMNGRGRIYVANLADCAIDELVEEDLLITEVVLSSNEQYVGYIVSKPGYYDFNIMHLPTGNVETIVSGEEVAAAGLPTSMRNVEWSPDGTRILYQVAQQIEVGDPAQTFSAYVANIDFDNKDDQFSIAEFIKLNWVTDGAHYLSWSSASLIIDAYSTSIDGSQYIEIKNVDGGVLSSIPVQDLLGTTDIIQQPVSMSPDGNQIVLTYGIRSVWLLDLQEGTIVNPLQEAKHIGVFLGKAEFCTCDS
jgi:hypothetical protein